MLMPGVLRRVGDFCKRYDPHTDPNVMVCNLAAAFTAPVAHLVAVAIMGENEELVGHCLLSSEPWTGKTFLVILQFEIDSGVHIPVSLYRAGMEILRGVATEAKAHYIQTLAYTEEWGDMRRARLFRRLGFESVGLTMRIPLAVPVPGDAATVKVESAAPKIDADGTASAKPEDLVH
jgi:hypothetical protein